MSINYKILVVDDEEDILEFIVYNLSKEFYHVYTAKTGYEALSVLKKEKIDLIILDVMLPDLSGFDLSKAIKKDEDLLSIPIIMISAKGEEADIITGLEIGADDYLPKPFSTKILLAKIRVLLRKHVQKEKAVKNNHFKLDEKRRKIFFKKKEIILNFSEFEILSLFIKNPDIVFSRYQIVDAVHGTGYNVTDRSIDVQIVSLRKKMGAASKYIKTVRGVGYKFIDDKTDISLKYI